MVVQKLHDPRKQVAIAQTKALVPPLSVKGVACKYMPPEFIKENGYIFFSF